MPYDESAGRQGNRSLVFASSFVAPVYITKIRKWRGYRRLQMASRKWGGSKKNGAVSESGMAQKAPDRSYKVAQLQMTSRKWCNFRRYREMARFQKVARPQEMARLQTVPPANRKRRGVG